MEEHRYLSQLLADLFKHPRPRRDGSGRDGLRFSSGGAAPVPLDDPTARAAVCIGSLLLLLVEERGGTHLPAATLRRLAESTLHTFCGSERARITDEVTRIFDWLAETLLERGESSDDQAWGDVHYEPAPYLPVITQAIHLGEDLDIDYFSYNRGEWTQRRVTPLRLEGRFTLVAHCHLRGDERRFRLSRIRAIRPLGPSPRPEPSLGAEGATSPRPTESR
ncbi:MAG: WYL domain-containing protein [Myxococcota bacterium]|jgi:predicted DNA-binding transcriptional regulator YafY|nr:WYL domain-containing protein [Myxococcota bacterium]